MALTYLDIVNAVLRDTNEVPLTAQNFVLARGFHAFVKEAINRALLDIVNFTDEWPWLAAVSIDPCPSPYATVIQAQRRQAIYEIPQELMEIDWDSCFMVDSTGKDTWPLKVVSYNEWQEKLSDDVLANRPDSPIARPEIIYRLHDGKHLGLSPVPDRDYQVQVVAWKAPTFLTAPMDTLPFPDRFYNVLVSRARYYAWLFRENIQMASAASNDYADGVKRMKQILIKSVHTKMRAV